MRITKAILPHFRGNHQGLIINVTSQGGRITFPAYSLYHATKFAVNGFTEALIYELATLNIRVKIVEPGATVTEFARRSMDLLRNQALTDYNHFEELVEVGYQSMYKDPESLSSPELIAEVIYRAATDPSNKLRYPAGHDAEQFLLRERKDLNDEEFVSTMAQRFGINID